MAEKSRFREILLEWIKPQGLVVIIAGLVWLIQLSVGYVVLTQNVSRLEGFKEATAKIDSEQNKQLAVSARLLNEVSSRLADLTREFRAHEKLDTHPVGAERIRQLEKKADSRKQ